MSTFKRSLSAFMAFVMVLSVFSGVAGVFAPKASAVAGTSMIKSYDALEAEYDKFIYLGEEAYEDDGSGNLILTDYYVQPGDWITYRLYVKSDLYVGNSQPYTSYDNSFFSVKVLTDDPVLVNGYETLNPNGVKNANHPMVINEALTHTATSKAATGVSTVQYCELDVEASEIDLVMSQWTKDITTYKYANIFTSDEWVLEWKVQVLEGLAEGTKGISQIYYNMFKYAKRSDTGVADARRPSDVSTLDCSTDIPLYDDNRPEIKGTKTMYVQRNIIQHFFVEDTYMEFTIGENPAGGGSGSDTPSGPVAGTSMIKSYDALEAEYDKFIYLGEEAYEDDGSGNLILTDYYVQPGDWITYRLYVKSDLYVGNSQPYTSYDNSFFSVKVLTDDPVLVNGYETLNPNGVKNANHPMVINEALTHTATSKAATGVSTVQYCELDVEASEIDLVMSQWTKDITTYKYANIFTSDEWVLEWKVQVLEGLAEGTKGISQIYYNMFKYAKRSDTGVADARRPSDVSTLDCSTDIPLYDDNRPEIKGTKTMYVQRNIIQHFFVEDTYMEFTIGENPAGGGSGSDTPSGPVAGTSMIKSYDALEAEYDKFIYLGEEAYEDDGNGNLILTDYYVQPGDWITYRLYVKSDLYVGNSQPYTSYDNSFFSVKVLTDNPLLVNGYETLNPNGVKNANHPMVINEALTHTATSKAATGVSTVQYCELDVEASEIDLVMSQWTKDITTYKYANIFTSDEWVLEWKVQVLEGLAEGTKGISQIYYNMFKYAKRSDTGVADARRPSDVSTLDCSTDIPLYDDNRPEIKGTKTMYVQRNIIQHFFVEDTYMEFTIGNPPAGGTTYTATFKVDGETYGDVASYAAGASIAAPADAPSKAGYTFKGWALEGTTDVLTFPQTMGSANVTYVAVFEEVAKYTVTFKVDGVQYGDVASYAEGETIVYPATNPTKTGYTFAGWDYTGTTMGTADLVINAKWTAKTYKVYYYLDDAGTNLHTDLNIAYGAAYNTPSAPSKEGYKFDGWYDAQGNALAGNHTIDGDAKFYAKWTKDSFTATFDAAGGQFADGKATATVTAEYGAAFSAPAAPTRTGFSFTGWSPEVPSVMGAANVTYVAQWEANAVGVYFWDSDRTTSLGEQIGSYGASVNAIADPVKEGYTFVHWADENGNKVTFPYVLGVDALNVYAVWDAQSFYIEFYNGDELITAGNQLCGDPIAAPDAPSKTGYTFAGWFDGDGNAMPETVPAKNAVYFATFRAVEYKVVFEADGEVHHETTVNYRGTITAPADPEKEGYSFSHWVRKGSTNKVNFPLTYTATVDVTYEAVFTINTYEINYYVDGVWQHKDSYEFGKEVTAWTYTPAEGETFSGWGDQVPATMPAQNVDVYGTTGTATYTVTFTVNGIKHAELPFAYGAPVTAPAYEVPEGYDFSGWDLPAAMPAQNITLDATLTAKTYNAIFYLDAEKTQVYDTVPTVYGEDIDFPMDPDVPGKEFTGWDNDATVMGAGDMEFVAMFIDIEYFIEVIVDGEIVEEWIKLYGDQITEDMMPATDKEGYDFLGWYVNGEKVELPYVITEEVSFEAQYEIQGYGVIYVVDGVEDKEAHNYGDAIALRADLVKEGYTFSGWKNANGEPAVLPATMPAEDIYVYGTFTVNKYLVTFNAGEGAFADGSKEKTIDVDYGTTPVAPEIPVKDGYGFAGWTPALAPVGVDGATYTATFAAGLVNYTVEIYKMDTTGAYGEPEAKTENAETDAVVSVTPETLEGFTFDADASVLEGVVAADGSTTLKVYYIRNQYDLAITIDGATETETYYYNEAVETVADPAKTGYSFKGWTVAIPVNMPANDVATEAIFEINQYTITFDTDGGSDIAPITADYDTAVVAPADPTKTGYTFAGWDKEIPGTIPAENVTITAQWTINQYTITFVDTGDNAYEPITQDYATDIDPVAEPVKTGYTFTGWDTEIPATMPAEDLTITATWTVNYYDATFVGNGGTFDGEATKPVSTAYGEIPVPVEPTRVGYKFAGWDTELVPMVVGGATYTAQWTALEYNAIFDANGGAWADGAKTVTKVTVFDTEIELPAEEPTREGYKFAGWDPEVGTMNVEGITFLAQWTQDLEFCRVKSITRVEPEKYYAVGRALYEIKVMGSPIKVQIVSTEYTGVTWTYDREATRVSTDLSASGLAEIKAYNAAGEEVALGSADTSYEIWKTVSMLRSGEYKVRAKVDYSSESWESLDFAYEYSVAYDEKPADTTMIVSAASDKATVVRGEYAKLNVVADADVTRLMFSRDNGDGTTTEMAFSESGSMVAISENADGTKTWAIDVRLSYAGDTDSVTYTWTVYYRATGDANWNESDKEISIKITKYAEVESPVVGEEPYSVISIDAPAEAAKGKYTDIVIKTTDDVTKLRFNNTATKKTSTYLTTSNNVEAVDNGDGTMTWTISYRFTVAGEQTWGIQVRGNAWSDIGDNAFTLTVA